MNRIPDATIAFELNMSILCKKRVFKIEKSTTSPNIHLIRLIEKEVRDITYTLYIAHISTGTKT
ncbi:MAG: hypothetical protein HEP71_15725 [Roseivirga sp.]|nr:hypothetical protein [Roseivirga sp.]